MTPRRGINGETFYSNRQYLTTLTHGCPSGQDHDNKKAVRLKIAGGNMAQVLHNKFGHEDI